MFFDYKMRYLVVNKKKESIFRVMVGLKNPSLVITICHHSVSLVMPIGDPRDGFYYPILTLMIDSYKLILSVNLDPIFMLIREVLCVLNKIFW